MSICLHFLVTGTFIVKNTLHRRPDVIKKIESGQRNLEDFYLDIVDVVNSRKITG